MYPIVERAGEYGDVGKSNSVSIEVGITEASTTYFCDISVYENSDKYDEIRGSTSAHRVGSASTGPRLPGIPADVHRPGVHRDR
ncbi:hypothetical protein NPIL_209561 [Nephila pilipes]|uniref:Uncharacterized protein n=1 Tax=Nephila pilipes TaxID=299642 RepID=A0A8X6PY06_NEPPI|nr:hypothetical protein NPIL_209561 [Nephila pilipes]